MGVEVIRYIPDDAFLVKAQAHKILELEISGEVSGVVPYLGSFKVSLEFPAVTLENKSKVVDVIVQLASEKEQSHKKHAHSEERLRILPFCQSPSFIP